MADLHVNLKNGTINRITGYQNPNNGLASGNGSAIEFYSGSAPGVGNASSGTKLAVVPMYVSNVSKMAASNMGVAILSSSQPLTYSAAGTIGYARFINSSYAVSVEGSVGLTESGADFIVTSMSVASGVTEYLTACSINWPESLGTVAMNSTLRDALVDTMVRNVGTMPGLGINGTVSIYTGSAPASVEEQATGTLLADFSTGAMAFAAASGGTANLAASLTATALDSGTPGYARWTKDSYVMQLSVGLSDADVILDSMSFVSGNSFSITDMSVSL